MDKKQPYRIVASGKKAERRDYSKVSGHLELPNLVEIQTNSFEWFKNEGIAEVFNESGMQLCGSFEGSHGTRDYR